MASRMPYDAILFDLLTALVDSWTLWNRAAGDVATARRWRKRYLDLTYAAGAYRPYEALVMEAAQRWRESIRRLRPRCFAYGTTSRRSPRRRRH